MEKLMRFFKDEDGVTAVEYAVMVAAIAALVIVGALFLGKTVNNTFNQVGTKVQYPLGS